MGTQLNINYDICSALFWTDTVWSYLATDEGCIFPTFHVDGYMFSTKPYNSFEMNFHAIRHFHVDGYMILSTKSIDGWLRWEINKHTFIYEADHTKIFRYMIVEVNSIWKYFPLLWSLRQPMHCPSLALLPIVTERKWLVTWGF